MACLQARDDIQSPVGLAVSIRITSYNVLAAVVIIRLQQGRTWEAYCCGERGLSIQFSAYYSSTLPRG